ncbi:MAG: carboxy terminal-processing peptidase, partial [Opitutaceae bacterium]|nr:carboxy terminal-processing peptidase [Opitutaceae bacterium]
GANAAAFESTPAFEREVVNVIGLLEHYHYNRDAVRPADYAEVVPNFMSDFDGQRLFFLESDKAAFVEKFPARWVYNNISGLGKIDPAFVIFGTYKTRVTDRINWVLEQLKTDIPLDTGEPYLVDRKDSPWPAGAAEADDIWTKRIKYELILEILNKKTPEEARENVTKRYNRMLKNLGEIEGKDVAESFLSSIARLYDPHSTYFSAETFEDFSIQMRLQLIGIGAVLSLVDDHCVINEIVTGGPADLSKQIRPKDKILFVGQDDGKEPVEVIGMKLRKIVDMIRGKKGTKVHLTIQPASDPSQRKQVTIVRDVVNLDSARARGAIYDVPAPGGGGDFTPIGVITLPAFYGPDTSEDGASKNSATQDIAELVKRLQAGGIRGLVLDLRGNGGGLLTEAIALSGLFIKPGPVVQVRDFYGKVKVDSSAKTDITYDGPLAVLVSKFSASASEIVAGALKNYGRAIIIGDSSTHGKGSVQQLIEMKDALPFMARAGLKTGAVKLTIQKFYLPAGESTQLRGVVPDIILPSIDDYLPVGEAELPRALAWDEIKPAPFNGGPLSPVVFEPLKTASVERQKTFEEFSYLNKSIDWFKNRQAEKILSLNLAEREKQRAADKSFHKEMDLERNRLAAAVGYTTREFSLVPPKPAETETNAEKTPAAENAIPGEAKLETNENTTVAKTGDGNAADLAGTPGAAAPSDLPDPTGLSLAKSGEPDEERNSEDENDSGLSDKQLQEDAKKLDIHLRESLRVLNDAIALARSPEAASFAGAPLTAQAVRRK